MFITPHCHDRARHLGINQDIFSIFINFSSRAVYLHDGNVLLTLGKKAALQLRRRGTPVEAVEKAARLVALIDAASGACLDVTIRRGASLPGWRDGERRRRRRRA